MELCDGKVFLAGFNLEPAERAIIDNILKNYAHKISERVTFDEMRLRLRKSSHGKAFIYEVEGKMKVKKNTFNTKVTDYNLFSSVAEALEKLLNEAVHKERK